MLYSMFLPRIFKSLTPISYLTYQRLGVV